MKITTENHISHFEFWCEAEKNRNRLTDEQMDQFEDYLTDCYPDGIDSTQLNDIFAYEFNDLAIAVLDIDFDALDEEEGDDDDETLEKIYLLDDEDIKSMEDVLY